MARAVGPGVPLRRSALSRRSSLSRARIVAKSSRHEGGSRSFRYRATRWRQSLALPACGIEIVGGEPALESRLLCRPFAVEDREPASIAVALLVNRGLAKHTLILETEALRG